MTRSPDPSGTPIQSFTQVYWNLLEKVEPKELKLTKYGVV